MVLVNYFKYLQGAFYNCDRHVGNIDTLNTCLRFTVRKRREPEALSESHEETEKGL